MLTGRPTSCASRERAREEGRYSLHRADATAWIRHARLGRQVRLKPGYPTSRYRSIIKIIARLSRASKVVLVRVWLTRDLSGFRTAQSGGGE
jgi:hypothetical protein